LETAAWECIECQDGQEAVDEYAETKPHLVLMDVAMQPLDGLSATAGIKARFPSARIMMLTQFDDAQMRSAASRADACGYILKENLIGLPDVIQAQNPAVETASNGSLCSPAI
jgi:DNA-binding NarL/FixJ family response regulator